jgi:hypothetical protein
MGQEIRNHLGAFAIAVPFLILLGVFILGVGFVAALITLTSRKPTPGWKKALAGAYLVLLIAAGIAGITGIVLAIKRAGPADDPTKPAIAWIAVDTTKSKWGPMDTAMMEAFARGALRAAFANCGYRTVDRGGAAWLAGKLHGEVCDMKCARAFSGTAGARYFLTGTMEADQHGGVLEIRAFRTETGQQLGSYVLRGKNAEAMLRSAPRRPACAELLLIEMPPPKTCEEGSASD